MTVEDVIQLEGSTSTASSREEGELIPSTREIVSVAGNISSLDSWITAASRVSWSKKVKEFRRSSRGEVCAYRELRQIGSGGFGNCFLLERTSDNALRVCKVQDRGYSPKTDEFEDAATEARILLDILPRHDRVVCLHEVIVQRHTVQLYYDYYEEGDLHHLIEEYKKRGQDIPEEFLWHAYRQLLEGLAFIHHGYDRRMPGNPPQDWTTVIHGDIKPMNIFLGRPDYFSGDPLENEYPKLVLGDFGLAALRPSNRMGTPVWQPPEIPVSSTKADVWGVGAVMHALAHKGKDPCTSWSDSICMHPCQWVEQPEARAPIPIFNIYSFLLHDCVFSALEFDPTRRPNSIELCKTVDRVWNSDIAPDAQNIKSLYFDPDEKWYDEGGCTMNTKDRIELMDQILAARNPYEVRISVQEAAMSEPKAVLEEPWADHGIHFLPPYNHLQVPVFPNGLSRPKELIMEEVQYEANANEKYALAATDADEIKMLIQNEITLGPIAILEGPFANPGAEFFPPYIPYSDVFNENTVIKRETMDEDSYEANADEEYAIAAIQTGELYGQNWPWSDIEYPVPPPQFPTPLADTFDVEAFGVDACWFITSSDKMYVFGANDQEPFEIDIRV